MSSPSSTESQARPLLPLMLGSLSILGVELLLVLIYALRGLASTLFPDTEAAHTAGDSLEGFFVDSLMAVAVFLALAVFLLVAALFLWRQQATSAAIFWQVLQLAMAISLVFSVLGSGADAGGLDLPTLLLALALAVLAVGGAVLLLLLRIRLHR